MAYFDLLKISFSTENPVKTIKNVIFFKRLKSGIIYLNKIIQIVKNSPPRSSGGYLFKVYIMTIMRRSVISRLTELTNSKFVNFCPYSKEEPHGCRILLSVLLKISQS